MKQNNIYIFFSLFVLLIGCSKEPKPIIYGEDECEFCKMLVMDKRYGSEMVTDKGKFYFFDSIECLVGYIDNMKMSKDDYHSLWVSNYAKPGNIIDAENAIYLKNDSLRSPMGLNVLAAEKESEIDPIIMQYGGSKFKFDELLPLVKAL